MPKFEEAEDIKGEGIIRLKTTQSGNIITTSSEHEFNQINTEGAIEELKKVIKILQKDLPKKGIIRRFFK